MRICCIEIGEFVRNTFGISKKDRMPPENAIKFQLAIGAHENFRILSHIVVIGRYGLSGNKGVVECCIISNERIRLAGSYVSIDDKQAIATWVVG